MACLERGASTLAVRDQVGCRAAEYDHFQLLHDAAGGVRTHDLRIKSPLLYQLSYSGGHHMIAYWSG